MPVRVSAYLYDVPGEASQVHLGGLGGGAAAAPLAVAVSLAVLLAVPIPPGGRGFPGPALAVLLGLDGF